MLGNEWQDCLGLAQLDPEVPWDTLAHLARSKARTARKMRGGGSSKIIGDAEERVLGSRSSPHDPMIGSEWTARVRTDDLTYQHHCDSIAIQLATPKISRAITRLRVDCADAGQKPDGTGARQPSSGDDTRVQDSVGF